MRFLSTIFTTVIALTFARAKPVQTDTSAALHDVSLSQRNEAIISRETRNWKRVHSFTNTATGAVYYMWQTGCAGSLRGNAPFGLEDAQEVAQQLFDSAAELVIHSLPMAYCAVTGELTHPDGSEYALTLDLAMANSQDLATFFLDKIYQPAAPGLGIAQQYIMGSISSLLRGTPLMGEWVLATANPLGADIPPTAGEMIATVIFGLALIGAGL